ncbi:MAG TPA: type II toxin-antitoxin system HicB family antitoxin, partial [Ktedonobacterales bacterium]|nr:type II toxin-antitoxin system HicB family antitoxin [Ktedonobacterales bacterium]
QNKQRLRYSMVIQWSDENQAYIVSIPEFPGNLTHGDTYEEAVKQGEELIESLIMWTQQDGKPLPEPHIFALPSVP